MADGLLLASQRVIPSRLTSAGYRFQQPDLAEALADVFRK
jgi:NAD dependent epimerase/dehydratase family enzyme